MNKYKHKSNDQFIFFLFKFWLVLPGKCYLFCLAFIFSRLIRGRELKIWWGQNRYKKRSFDARTLQIGDEGSFGMVYRYFEGFSKILIFSGHFLSKFWPPSTPKIEKSKYLIGKRPPIHRKTFLSNCCEKNNQFEKKILSLSCRRAKIFWFFYFSIDRKTTF